MCPAAGWPGVCNLADWAETVDDNAIVPRSTAHYPLLGCVLLASTACTGSGKYTPSLHDSGAKASATARADGGMSDFHNARPEPSFDSGMAATECAHELAGDDLQDITASSDVYGIDVCRSTPRRLIVLGDSIAACSGLSGMAESPDCFGMLIADHLRGQLAPDLVTENHAAAGARTASLLQQAVEVEPGPGHVWVLVYAIGNDLAGHAMESHGDVLAFINTGIPRWGAAWQTVFDYFGDVERFPDGVTYLLNTQYSPYDLCPDPGSGHSGISDFDEGVIRCVNRLLFREIAEARTDAVAVDQYPGWLGHGNNADVPTCPYYSAGAESWMADSVHPNVLGNRHLAESWFAAIDQMRTADCP
jgi:hypothetical protein